MKTTKIKRNPVGLVELRKSFALSQKLMAMYLKISISTLKLVETGRRLLPTHALLTVAGLEMQLASKNENIEFNTIHPLEQAYYAALKEQYHPLQARENKCRTDKKLLQNKLNVMKCNYQKIRAGLQIIDRMIGENNIMDAELQEWQKEKNKVAGLLTKCGLPLQLMIIARLEILENEIRLYDKLKLQLSTALPGFF